MRNRSGNICGEAQTALWGASGIKSASSPPTCTVCCLKVFTVLDKSKSPIFLFIIITQCLEISCKQIVSYTQYSIIIYLLSRFKTHYRDQQTVYDASRKLHNSTRSFHVARLHEWDTIQLFICLTVKLSRSNK